VETPVISVVVVNWNRRDLLRACLDSLAAQTFTDFEIIVVDNGSRDGSVEMVKNFSLPIRLIENPENRGSPHPSQSSSRCSIMMRKPIRDGCKPCWTRSG
jgi:GT2 family glycosyltransferase